MKRIALLFLTVTAWGCAVGAVPASGPDAMTVVWEQTYGMEKATEPTVAWHDECRTADSTGNRVTSIKNGCVISIVQDDGLIEIQSALLVSDSDFALALEQWREWLTMTAFAPIDGNLIANANAALVADNL